MLIRYFLEDVGSNPTTGSIQIRSDKMTRIKEITNEEIIKFVDQIFYEEYSYTKSAIVFTLEDTTVYMEYNKQHVCLTVETGKVFFPVLEQRGKEHFHEPRISFGFSATVHIIDVDKTEKNMKLKGGEVAYRSHDDIVKGIKSNLQAMGEQIIRFKDLKMEEILKTRKK